MQPILTYLSRRTLPPSGKPSGVADGVGMMTMTRAATLAVHCEPCVEKVHHEEESEPQITV